MLRAVNINETVAGIGVVWLDPVEPENAREDEVVSRGHRVLRREWNAAAKDRVDGKIGANLLANLKSAQRGLHAAFLRAQAKAGSGDGITGQDAIVADEVETLFAHGDSD